MKSNSGYMVIALVLAAGIAFMLYSRCSGDEAKPDKPVVTAPKPVATPKPPPMDFAPPPPPEEPAPSATASASAAASAVAAPRPGGKPGGGVGPCSKCGEGVPSSALRSAVSSTAGLARGCYNRALKGGGGEGTLTVSVRVGSTGQLCGANVSGNVGNPGLKQCVLSKFNSRSYPPPQEGCVVINVPISFKTKQ